MRSADDRGVITLEVTLGRTGHTPEPVQNRRPLDQTRVRLGGLGGGRCRRLGVSCRVRLEPRARIGMRPTVAMRLATQLLLPPIRVAPATACVAGIELVRIDQTQLVFLAVGL
jgi:hypothetical protein